MRREEICANAQPSRIARDATVGPWTAIRSNQLPRAAGANAMPFDPTAGPRLDGATLLALCALFAAIAIELEALAYER